MQADRNPAGAGGRNQSSERTRYQGISKIHGRGCDWRTTRCSCSPSYKAWVFLARENRKVRRNFDSLSEARAWREDAAGAVRQGKMRAPTRTTVAEAAGELIAGMRSGMILTRSGDEYKPATVRTYDEALELRILPAIGHMRLGAVERRDVQRLVNQWRAAGLKPSTVQNTLNPLQVIARRAVRDGALAIDPTNELDLPAIRGRRERIASPDEAELLIASLPTPDQALWATAFYAGLRRGELRALRWDAVDFDAGVIHVRASWDADPAIGEIDPKSAAGRRRVPILTPLRKLLALHKLATGRDRGALVFGSTAEVPFVPSTIRNRSFVAWGWKHVKQPDGVVPRLKWEKARDDALDPIGLHEARHSAASYLIAAGLNPKQISVYIGHSDVRTTYNVYGHLMPGDEVVAAAQVDAYLRRCAQA